ncbi:MAG: TVP38/TMEM64 family protein [Candidatus Hodarchaeota archaeon]
MEKANDNINEKKSFSERLKSYVKNIFNFSQYDKKTILYIIVFIALVIFSVFLLFYAFFIDSTFLYRIVIDWFVNPIYYLGILGILLFIVIMAIQGLLIPIPSEFILIATGIIWGLIGGGIMGVIGSMSAATLCYYISKRGGRPLAKKFVGEKAINLADNFIHKYGMGAIIIARFLPVIAFDPISYTSGLVDIDFKKYTIGTFLGSIPRAFFFSWLGSIIGITPPVDLGELPLATIEAQAAFFNNILLIILGLLAIMFALYYLISWYYGKKIDSKQTS